MKRRPVARNAKGNPVTRRNSGSTHDKDGAAKICAAWADNPTTAMPIQPPAPAGRLAGAGRMPSPAATMMVPSGQATSRHMAWRKLRPVRARMPHTSKGAKAKMAANPNVCSNKSAAVAPSGPSRLETGRPLALLKLASSP